MPFSWAASSASAIWRAMRNASSSGIAPSFDAIRERRPLHQFHHQVVGTDVVERADIGMIQRRDGARLALEPLGELLARNLDRDRPAQPRVVRLVDLAHAAGANQRGYFVGTETLSCDNR